MDIYNLISLTGIVIITVFAWGLSEKRKNVNWHVVVWGVGLQMLMAWFLFIFPFGTKVFLFLNDLVSQVLNSSMAGAKFIFGPLAIAPGMEIEQGRSSLGFILAFQAFPTIIFFSALMSILYYWNIIPRIIRTFSFFFTKLMKVSGAESLCTAANIFVGVESAFIIRPYLKNMTRSELCTVLTAGMATVSSSVLAVYVFSLKDVFPNIAAHLISASFLSAPAALMMSKILLPETEHPETLGEDVKPFVEKEGSLFEAIIQGSQAGAKLIVGIVALLIAVLGLVALSDQILGFLGDQINHFTHLNFEWSFRNILGIVFYPFTVILGMPLADARILAKIIGERLVLTELTAYQDLATVMAQGVLQNPRSAVLATYALCGFAHVASMAIFVGGIAAIVPEKTRVLSEVCLRALLAATLACLMTACVAGVFLVHNNSILLGR